MNVQEASDKGTYLPYWENIKQLVDTVNNSSEEQEIVNLEVYKLAMNAMETYARKFKSDGITKEDMEMLAEQVKNGIEATETTTDKTTRMKEEIISRIPEVEKAINNAFAKDQEVKE